MAACVPFFNIYLKSLTDATTIRHAISEKPKMKSNSSSIISFGYKLTRNIETSMRSTSTIHSPLLRLSPKIWLIILRYLPLCRIPELNLVCRRLFCMVRFKSCFWLHVWKVMHPNSFDLNPVFDGTTLFECLTKLEWTAYTKVKLTFGLACDFCFQGEDFSANKDGSSAVLRVLSPYNNDSNTELQQKQQYLYLCLPCRRQHYTIYPEPILNDNLVSFTYSYAIYKYYLPEWFMPQESTILKIDAIALGRRIYGGDVGIQAEQQRIAYGAFEGGLKLPGNHK